MNQSLNVFKTFVVILTVVFILSGVSKVVHAEQNNKEKNEQQELLLPKSIYPLEFVNFDSSSNIIPLNQRLTKAHPSTTGLYPHEILVLGYAETFSSSQTEFQKFWLYKYSINNVHEVISSLIDRGYLEYGSIEQTLNNQTTKELKATLSLYSLKVSGKKEELIKRLLENVSEDKLRELYPEKYYKLTNKGKAELNENEYVLLLG